MKVQQDSVEERTESPDLPEPLYEEVGDFGLQVLKSLETSFRSSRVAETQEVPDHLPLRLVLSETGHLEHLVVPEEVQTASSAEEAPETSSAAGGGGAVRKRQQLSEELLLQELSSAFTKKEEQEEEEERPYDI